MIKKKAIPELSVEEIVNKYSGFEGELISIFIVDKEIEGNAIEIIDQLLEVKKLGNYSMLYVISGDEVVPSFLKVEAVWRS